MRKGAAAENMNERFSCLWLGGLLWTWNAERPSNAKSRANWHGETIQYLRLMIELLGYRRCLNKTDIRIPYS